MPSERINAAVQGAGNGMAPGAAWPDSSASSRSSAGGSSTSYQVASSATRSPASRSRVRVVPATVFVLQAMRA